MKRIYLLGYPLNHSISPAFQNAALQARNLRAVVYEKLALPSEKIETMLAAVRAEDCIGANITIPHKQVVMPYLDELSDTARTIGAVNTLVKRNGKLVGENTDAFGFIESLRQKHISPRNSSAFIIGAGGAASAVCYALATEGAREIILVNRTLGRAVDLADHLHEHFPDLDLAVNDWAALEYANIIVNASAVGMSPHKDESPLPAGSMIPGRAAVIDLVYNPPETPLLRLAETAGAQIVGGLEMLIHQGARAFEMWTGEPAPVEVMRAAAIGALREQSATSTRASSKKDTQSVT